MSETILLDPEAITGDAAGELSIATPGSQGAIEVLDEGVDWGDMAIEAIMAQLAVGALPVDYEIPNRIITMPIKIQAWGDTTFAQARSALQAKVAAIQGGETGWISRDMPGVGTVYADLVNAKLNLPGDWMQAHRDIQIEATLSFEAIPDFYEVEWVEAEFTNVEAGENHWRGVIENVRGDFPKGNRCKVRIESDSTGDLRAVRTAFLCRHYSGERTAAPFYPAEAMRPLDRATITTLSGASGAATNNVIRHDNLGTSWTPILSLELLPAVRAIGGFVSGVGGVTPPLPDHEVNDILLLLAETAGGEAITPPDGWAHVNGSPVNMASGDPTRLSLLWRRAGAIEAAPAIADPGDHIGAMIISVSGCIETGDPWDVTATGTEATSDTSVSIPGATTTVDGCLVLAAFSTGTDGLSVPQTSAWVNADLQALTEVRDQWHSNGNGGGFAIVSGVKAKRGAYGATTATIANAGSKALLSIALKPKLGGNLFTHTGTRRLGARVHVPQFVDFPELRAVYGVGDLGEPAENLPIACPGGGENFYLVDLGTLRLDAGPLGLHRFAGQIQGRGVSGGETVSIDGLELWPADEHLASVTVPVRWLEGIVDYVARDELNQSAGAVDGKTLAVGGAYQRAGDATDYTVDDTNHVLVRSAVSDSGAHAGLGGGCYALAGSTVLTDIACRVDFKTSSVERGISLAQGLALRYGGTSDALLLEVYPDWHDGSRVALNGWTGSASDLGSTLLPPIAANAWYTLGALLLADGHYAIWLAPKGDLAYRSPIMLGRNPALATGGTLDSGRAGIYDCFVGADATTRTYDNFAMWVPQTDAAVFAGRAIEMATDGAYREARDGVSAGIVTPFGNRPRLPQSGPDGRPVEVIAAVSQGDLDRSPDFSLAEPTLELSYRPCWLTAPGGA